MIFFASVIAVILILQLTPPKKKRLVFLPALALGAIGAAYGIYEFTQAFNDFPGRWIIAFLFFVALFANLIIAYRTTAICESCGYIGFNPRHKRRPQRCSKCHNALDGSVDIEVIQRTLPAEPPPLPSMPRNFTVETNGSICTIRHARGDMKAMSVFLGIFLTFWTGGCVMLVKQYLQSDGDFNNGAETPLWMVLIFIGSWFLVAVALIYSIFVKKKYELNKNTLLVETELLSFRRRRHFSRDSISVIRQLKDGGEDEDSFPSWGLLIVSSEAGNSILDKSIAYNNFHPPKSFKLLSRVSYQDSEWLGITLAHWTNADLQLCSQDT